METSNEDMLDILSGIRRGNTTQQQLADAITAYLSEVQQGSPSVSNDENVTMVTAPSGRVKGLGLGISREQLEALKAQAEASGEQLYLMWDKEKLEQLEKEEGW